MKNQNKIHSCSIMYIYKHIGFIQTDFFLSERNKSALSEERFVKNCETPCITYNFAFFFIFC